MQKGLRDEKICLRRDVINGKLLIFLNSQARCQKALGNYLFHSFSLFLTFTTSYHCSALVKELPSSLFSLETSFCSSFFSQLFLLLSHISIWISRAFCATLIRPYLFLHPRRTRNYPFSWRLLMNA